MKQKYYKWLWEEGAQPRAAVPHEPTRPVSHPLTPDIADI
jgi:hypothetical protein